MKEKLVDAIVNLLKLESLISLAMTLTFCVGCFLVMKAIAPELPEPLVNAFSMIIGYFFGQKSGRQLAKVEYLSQAVEESKDE